MVCDCTTSRDERSRGMVACGENCLNRLLMIEWWEVWLIFSDGALVKSISFLSLNPFEGQWSCERIYQNLSVSWNVKTKRNSLERKLMFEYVKWNIFIHSLSPNQHGTFVSSLGLGQYWSCRMFEFICERGNMSWFIRFQSRNLWKLFFSNGNGKPVVELP